MSKSKTKKNQSSGIPLVVFIATMGGAIIGYIIGETALYPKPHPYHWMVALAGLGVGYLVGLLIYRLRGDIL